MPLEPSNALYGPALLRAKCICQFVSQLSPSSRENACSHLQASGESTNQSKRTRIGWSPSVSLPKNTPCGPSKPPTTGGPNVDGHLVSSQKIDHSARSASNVRTVI